MNTAQKYDTSTQSAPDFATEQHSAKENSKRVSLLKKVLIIGCVLVFGCVASFVYYFNYLTGIDLDSISISSGGLVMTAPVLTGGDATTKYEITAKEAIQDLNDPNTITLNKISATIDNAEDESFKLHSDEGVFNAKDDKLKLNQNVKIHGNNSYSAYSRSASIDFVNDQFESGDFVYIYSKNITLEAQKAFYDKSNLKFFGGVKVIIQPTNKSENQ